MGCDLAWFAIYTAVKCLILILEGSVQEMVGLFLSCEFDVMMVAVETLKCSVGLVFYFLREAVVCIPVLDQKGGLYGQTTSAFF